MLNDATKTNISDYLGLALGLFLSAQVTSTSNEYDLRNSISRLYYAFFHVSLAFLLSQGEQVDRFRHSHGGVHAVIDKRMGKSLGRFIREIYQARRKADYEPKFFSSAYGVDIEKARLELRTTIKLANTNFYWIYYESRKVL